MYRRRVRPPDRGIIEVDLVAGNIAQVVAEAATHELVDFVSRGPSWQETLLAEYSRTSA